MRPSLVVVAAPLLDGRAGIGQADEPALVQALVAQPAVEALDVAVLHRLAWLDEVEQHAVRMCPLIRCLTRELAAIIADDALWQPAGVREPIQHARDAFARERGIDLNRRTLSREVVDNREGTKGAPVAQVVVHQVHAPALIACGDDGLHHASDRDALAAAPSDRKVMNISNGVEETANHVPRTPALAMVPSGNRASNARLPATGDSIAPSAQGVLTPVYATVREILSQLGSDLTITSSGTWMYFTFPERRPNVLLRYRIPDAWAELSIVKKAVPGERITEAFRAHPLRGGDVSTRGKTETAIWMSVPEVDLDAGVAGQRDRLVAAVGVVETLKRWYVHHATLLHGSPIA